MDATTEMEIASSFEADTMDTEPGALFPTTLVPEGDAMDIQPELQRPPSPVGKLTPLCLSSLTYGSPFPNSSRPLQALFHEEQQRQASRVRRDEMLGEEAQEEKKKRFVAIECHSEGILACRAQGYYECNKLSNPNIGRKRSNHQCGQTPILSTVSEIANIFAVRRTDVC